jgi:hypothetical protein
MPPVSAVMLLTAAITLAVLATLVFYVMIGKVNEKLPEDQKIPYFFTLSYSYLSKPTIVRREYKRFYPSGKLHIVRIVLQVIAFALAVVAAKQFSYWWR